ncbi:MAG TPA: hypothetical protein VKB95_02785 [Chitinophagaceae bacterium]|nr:hypothetical protein [Chitinophagaceae bacterium]
MFEEKLSHIIELLKKWMAKRRYTYENKVPLSPTVAARDGEVVIILTNTVTFIRTDKTIKISSEAPFFRYNLYSDDVYQERLEYLMNRFDEEFYKEVEDKKSESDIDTQPFFD